MAQDTSPQVQKLKFGLHVHVYVTLSFITLFIAVFVLAGVMTHRGGSTATILIGACSGVTVFGALLWLTARYCSSEVISYFNGLRLISAYVSYNIGAISLFLSLVSIAATIVITSIMTLLCLATGNRRYAQHIFVRILQFFSDHRMYQ
jgi:hypothetical protein